MTFDNYLNYYQLPSGNLIVYSKDEVIIMTGTVKEVSDRLDYIIRRFREYGLDPAKVMGTEAS